VACPIIIHGLSDKCKDVILFDKDNHWRLGRLPFTDALPQPMERNLLRQRCVRAELKGLHGILICLFDMHAGSRISNRV
jgi:hypothetical protein